MGRDVKIPEGCYPGAIFPSSTWSLAEEDIEARRQAEQCAQGLTQRDRESYAVIYKKVEPIPGSMGFGAYYEVVEKTSAESHFKITDIKITETDPGCGCAVGAKPKSSFFDQVLTMFSRLFGF